MESLIEADSRISLIEADSEHPCRISFKYIFIESDASIVLLNRPRSRRERASLESRGGGEEEEDLIIIRSEKKRKTNRKLNVVSSLSV